MDKPVRRNPALRLALIRRIHTWLGVFVAPSVLFFALTGAVQLYGLHESHDGYKPAPVVEKLGMLHKDQVLKLKPKRAKPPAAVAAAAAPTAAPKPSTPAEQGPKPAVVVLKALFLIVALSLTAATVLGVWMAVFHGRERKAAVVLLAAGTAIPVILALLTQGG
jgi:hypothetical protein